MHVNNDEQRQLYKIMLNGAEDANLKDSVRSPIILSSQSPNRSSNYYQDA